MEYSLPLQELIKRPFIRSDKSELWENKMTDEELEIYHKELDIIINEYPIDERLMQYTTKPIDRTILYKLLKLAYYKEEFVENSIYINEDKVFEKFKQNENRILKLRTIIKK